jgi:hypothetical protein
MMSMVMKLTMPVLAVGGEKVVCKQRDGRDAQRCGQCGRAGDFQLRSLADGRGTGCCHEVGELFSVVIPGSLILAKALI